MPVFAQLVAAFFSGLSVFLAKLLAARIAIRIAAVTTIAALGTGLMVAFNGTVAPLAASLFATPYGQLLGLVFPPVAGTCLAAFVGTWMACTTYKLQVHAIKVTANL